MGLKAVCRPIVGGALEVIGFEIVPDREARPAALAWLRSAWRWLARDAGSRRPVTPWGWLALALILAGSVAVLVMLADAARGVPGG